MIEISVALYKKVFLIRRVEEKIIEIYHENDMKSPMHMSMGQEAIPAGVCQALSDSDHVLGTYRSHALYLAKTGDTDDFFFEMYGKQSNIANGKNGSMHLCSLENGLLCSSAIVGSTIPVAAGVAFANKYKKNNLLTAVFLGDGATDEGAFWESVNFACLNQLPILFILEDNDVAVHTFKRHRQGFESITKVIAQYKINVNEAKGNDPEMVYNTTKKAIEALRKNQKPVFLRFSCHRYLEHVGISEDYEAGYRKKENYAKWYEHDPVKIQKKKLVESGLSPEVIVELERSLIVQIDKSIDAAKNKEFDDSSGLYKGVFIEKNHL